MKTELGHWQDKDGVTKINLKIEDNCKMMVDLVNMTNKERNNILAGIRNIFGSNYRTEKIKNGVRVYAPAYL